MVLEKTLEIPLDCKDIQPVHLKGDQSWVFIARTDVEAETPILWPPDAKSWLIWKDPDVWKDWRWEEKGTIEDEMVWWHHWLNEHEFGWTPGVGDGQGGLVCCSPWGCKESDTTERLNWLTDTIYEYMYIISFILTTVLQDKNINCPHFADEQTETEIRNEAITSANCQMEIWNKLGLAPTFTHLISRAHCLSQLQAPALSVNSHVTLAPLCFPLNPPKLFS